jgi:hypothetical protein
MSTVTINVETLASLMGLSQEMVHAAIARAEKKPKAQVKGKRRLYTNSVTTAAPAQAPKAQPQVRTSRSGVTYGQAPCGPTAQGTHALRCQALEQAMPGFCKANRVWSMGKDAAGKLTKHFNEMVNSPFTWIELDPAWRGQNVRDTLKALGYGYSAGNSQWGTDSHGKPVHRVPFAKCQGVAKQMIDVQ